MTADVDDKKPTEKKPAKKPYEPPKLKEWGTLRDLTKAVGWSGNEDGGKGKQPRRTR
jgi:hypothetical protein